MEYDKHQTAPAALRGALALLRRKPFGVLATSNGTQPHASIVAFAFETTKGVLLFITPKRTKKYAFLARNPAASFVIDARPATSSALARSAAITLHAIVSMIHDDTDDRSRRIFTKKHPSMRHFTLDPAYALCEFRITRATYAKGIETVSKIGVRELRSLPQTRNRKRPDARAVR